MKLATWNVNSIKARESHVRSWVEENTPDVLMLQEIKGEAFPEETFAGLGYECYTTTQKSYNGVATLIRRPEGAGSAADPDIISHALGGNEEDGQARYLEIAYKGMRLINIYLPNGNPVDSDKFPYKLEWMDRLIGKARTCRKTYTPFIIAGDFNVIPAPRDCHDPKSWEGDALYRYESRARYRALLNLGLYDAYRVLHPLRSEAYTFWDYQGGAWPANKGIRIDHALLSPCICDRLESAEIDTNPRALDKPSDHTPLVITIRDKDGIEGV